MRKLWSVVRHRRGGVLALAMVAALVAPASAMAQETAQAQTGGADEAVNDPIEPINRFLFEFNEILQALILRPVGEFYQGFVPPPMRRAVNNVLQNLRSPIILANDLMQGEGQRAWQTTQRAVINTTLGIGGLSDRAAEVVVASSVDEDFGQTLAVWGVGEGFYVVLPVFGPSSQRDGVGKFVVDGYLDPLAQWLDNTGRDDVQTSRLIVDGVDTYAGVMDDLAQIKKTSIDYYAAIRSMYRQKRRAEILNGSETDLPPIPNINYEISGGTSRIEKSFME